MNLELVSAKVVYMLERPTAAFADERPHVGMNVRQMSTQTDLPLVSFSADAANEWAFILVDYRMSSQVYVAGKHLFAAIAS